MPRSATPADHLHHACDGADNVAFRSENHVGSALSFLSRLYHAAYQPPVYASQPRSPSHHATLGPGWRLTLCRGRTCTCEFSQKVSICHSFTYHPPSPGLTWRTFRGNASVCDRACPIATCLLADSLRIEQASFDHEQICQSRRRFQSIQILRETSFELIPPSKRYSGRFLPGSSAGLT
jgi:hypothetical protein